MITHTKTMTQIVDEIDDYVSESKNYERGCKILFAWKEFLKQPLKLEMFIACGKDGKPLEKPELYEKYILSHKLDLPDSHRARLKEFQEAEKKVLFEGWWLEETRNKGNIIARNQKGETITFWVDDKIYIRGGAIVKTIESIAHLELPLSEAGKQQLI